MRALRGIGLFLAALLLVGVATYGAGEQTEVAVLRTRDASGAAHETKLWVVDLDGAAWVRVARPERQWFQRLRAEPEIEIIRHGGAPQRVRATPEPTAETKATLDRAFREKYGLVDWWYGVLLRSNPIPVRLDAAPLR
jgi:hypothetical protein